MRAVNIKEMEMHKGNDISDILNGSECCNANGGFILKCMDASDNMSAKMEVMRQLSVKTTTHHKAPDSLLLKRKKRYFLVRCIAIKL